MGARIQTLKTWLVALAAIAAICPGRAANIVWNNTSGGNWSKASNWTPHHMPAAGDTAIITNAGNYTVTLDVSTKVAGLVLGRTNAGSTQTFSVNGQTFTLDGTAKVNASGIFNLSSGTLKGDTNTSGTVFSGTLSPSGGLLVGKLTMTSNSILNFAAISGASVLSGLTLLTNYGTVVWGSIDLNGDSGPQIYNYGLWDAQTNKTFYGGNSGGTTIFNNYGTFRKSGFGRTLMDSHTTFNNYGTVDVQRDEMDIFSGTGSGLFNNGTNAATDLLNGYILTGSPTFTGPGFIYGSPTGSNAVINGTLNFNGGSVSGTLTVASNATVNLSTDVSNGGTLAFAGTILTNYGTVNWSNTDLYGASNSQIYNYGLWDADAKLGNTFYGGDSGGTTTFNNYGTFRKSGDRIVGRTMLDNHTTFNNTGTVDVQIDELDIFSGSGSGIFNIATNALIAFINGSSYILTGNPTFMGSGFVEGYPISSNAVIGGTMNFDYGAISGTLTVATNATVNLSSSGPVGLGLGGTITNYGTVNWISGDLSGSGAGIDNYGLWDAKTDNFFNGPGNPTTFNNHGIFRKSGGTSGSGSTCFSTTFNNSGMVDVQSGQLTLGGSYALTGGTLNFGINSSNNFGSLFLTNNAALTGALSVNLTNGYSPAAGSSFALVSYSSATGVFTAMNLPHLSGLIWQTNYGATTFTLSVTNLPSPYLSSAKIQNGNAVSLSWNALAGQTYQIQSTTNLASGNWVNLGGPISGTNGPMTMSDGMGTNRQQFYRVVVQ